MANDVNNITHKHAHKHTITVSYHLFLLKLTITHDCVTQSKVSFLVPLGFSILKTDVDEMTCIIVYWPYPQRDKKKSLFVIFIRICLLPQTLKQQFMTRKSTCISIFIS